MYDLSEVLINFDATNHSSVILRNYIEPGNFVVTDDNHLSSLHYCVIGDTHHLAHSLSWCFECLVRLRPTIFFSRSNPHHAILLANSPKLTYGLESRILQRGLSSYSAQVACN